MKVEEILEKLVGFNTIKDKENKEIIDFIEEFLLNQDFKRVVKDKYLIMESNFGNEEYGIGFVITDIRIVPTNVIKVLIMRASIRIACFSMRDYFWLPDIILK